MKFTVIRPFRDLDGIVKMPGCTLEIEFVRASQLRRLGLIGQVAPERAVIMPQEKAVRPKSEKAVRPKSEKAVRPPGKKRRGRKPKKQEITPPESAEENTENGVETDNASGD